jgi:hypothetical protein
VQTLLSQPPLQHKSPGALQSLSCEHSSGSSAGHCAGFGACLGHLPYLATKIQKYKHILYNPVKSFVKDGHCLLFVAVTLAFVVFVLLCCFIVDVVIVVVIAIVFVLNYLLGWLCF